MRETSIFPNYVFNKETGWRENLPANMEEGTRVLCLYRVSTDKQLYHNDNNEADIPMQRVRCREFCEQRGWTIICEMQEEGVSGHKVGAENRDKIQLIKEYALQKRFDILLVFMFDRIGRIADETPFVVEWFVRNGIRVWSTQEGEQRIDSNVDKLINYIRFWQADGESVKTSIRTSNSLKILTEQGYFTGGVCPYGYEFVKSSRLNKKKQAVNDLAVNDEEAQIVKQIFEWAQFAGYGAQRIANLLNEKGVKNRSGKNWHPSTIQGILKNSLYTGVLQNGDASATRSDLLIVSKATFEKVHEMLAARSRKNEAIRSAPLNTRGNSLLSGMVFCGHCGARLCVTTSGKGRKKRDGTDTVRTRYTCQTKSRTHGDCDGQTGYTVERLDKMIEAIVLSLFERVERMDKSEIVGKSFQDSTNLQKALLQKVKREYEKAEEDLTKLKCEVVKAITGESSFSAELLSSIIEEKDRECHELKEAYNKAEQELKNSANKLAKMGQQYDELLEWSSAYKNATMATKKMIVSNLIERVDVFRGYKLKIKLKISSEQFFGGLSLNELNEESALIPA
jgi:DNA invertase Pin-like site-specific DNA recombinase